MLIYGVLAMSAFFIGNSAPTTGQDARSAAVSKFTGIGGGGGANSQFAAATLNSTNKTGIRHIDLTAGSLSSRLLLLLALLQLALVLLCPAGPLE